MHRIDNRVAAQDMQRPGETEKVERRNFAHLLERFEYTNISLRAAEAFYSCTVAVDGYAFKKECDSETEIEAGVGCTGYDNDNCCCIEGELV